MIRRFGGILSISIALLGAALPHAQAETAPVLEFANANSFLFPDNASLGLFLTTNQATVVALDDFWSFGRRNNNVRLYDGSGNVLAATVTTSDPTEGSPFSFYTQSIASVTGC